MSPTFIISSALALATAAGITIKIIHEDDETKHKIVTAPTTAVAPEVRNDRNKEVKATVLPNASEEPKTSDETTTIEILTLPSTLNPSTLTTIGITALRADDDIVRSLGLEPQAVQEICRNLAGADSLTNCSIDMSDAKVKVCVFKDGTPDEVVIMDKPGPMPVMFTSSDGKGRVVASHFSREVDPNKLVPVAAKGCGDNMIMWFQPTQDFVMSMPDSLSKDLERILDVEVRIDTKDGKTKMTRRQKNADGTFTEEEEEVNMPDISQMAMKFNLDSMLKSVNVDSVLKSVDIQMNDLNKSMKIFINKQMLSVDSVMQDVDSLIKELNIQVDSSNANTLKQQQMIFRFRNSDGSVDPSSCTPQIQRYEFMTSPNIRSRVIVMTKGAKKLPQPEPPHSIDNASLQETRTSQGAIAATMLYPNPTSDGGATMSFSLASPRTLNMSLLTLSGEKVMDLARNVYRTQGDGQLAFALNNTAPGMYLVVLETDQGERVVQRLIVQ